MNTRRRMRLWGRVIERSQGGPVTVGHVCAVAIAEAAVDGAGVTVILPSRVRETLYATDPVALELAELPLLLGEGPGVDALASGPTLAADLAASDCMTRWPMFAVAGIQAGARAVFALPLQVGAIKLGVLELYRRDPGDLGREQLSDALLLADTACALLLDSGRPQVNGRLPEHSGLQHPEVHQATGMMIVQLGVGAAVALIRLRAYAYAHDRHLRDVAGEVVARRLRFAPEEDGVD